MPEYLERARLFRERAEQLRRIAAEFTHTEQRPVLEEADREYDEMAESEAAKSLVRRGL